MGTTFSIVDTFSKQRKKIFKKKKKNLKSVRPNNYITPPKQSGSFKIPLSKSRNMIYQDKILNKSKVIKTRKNKNIMYSFKDRGFLIPQSNEDELVYEQINKMYVHNNSNKMVSRLLSGGDNNLIFEPPFKGAETKSISYDSEDNCILNTIDGELDSIYENINNCIEIDSVSSTGASQDTDCGSG